MRRATRGLRQQSRLWGIVLAVSISSCVHGAAAWTAASSRRELIRNGFLFTGNVGLVWFLDGNEPAHAARGAAELDLEFYVRDLIGGNKKEGNILPSAMPGLPPPRTLKEPLVSWLLNNECSSDCLSTAILIQQVQEYRTRIGNRDTAKSTIESEIQQSMTTIREKARRSFYAKAPWMVENVADQYYFDLTAYALWRSAATLLPNYVDRECFVRQLGRAIYDRAIQTGHVSSTTSNSASLTATNESARELLQLFVSSQFCKTFRMGTDDKQSSSSSSSSLLFDDLDDEALTSGATVDVLISILEPATLGASLQITAEQSRFAPDFIGPTLAALWQSQLPSNKQKQLQISWETFFVDPVYRPNPKDYFPNEQLFQYSLTLQE
jgi:hypothetical protein